MSGHSGCGCGGRHDEQAKRDDKKGQEQARDSGRSDAVPDAGRCQHGEHSKDGDTSRSPAADKRRGSCCE